MSAQSPDDAARTSVAGPPGRKGPWPLLVRTLAKAWHGNIFSEAAEAAFWQTLSLPPLLLGLLGSLGYVGDWFGTNTVNAVQEKIISFCRTVFSTNVVTTIIEPTVADILTKAQTEVASIGFVISLWAGSSAMASFVDAITVAYDQYGVRHEVWQRIFALLLYLVGLVMAIIGLPVLALGPDLLPRVFPPSWRDNIADLIGTFYYPVVAVLLVIALCTLYKVALPRKLPWYRGLPGAVLAMVFFMLASIGIRIYLIAIGRTGYTYGALAAPIAFLLFTFFIGLAIVIGAHFNSAIQEMWPTRMTHRQRRRWRRLEMERATERMKSAARDLHIAQERADARDRDGARLDEGPVLGLTTTGSPADDPPGSPVSEPSASGSTTPGSTRSGSTTSDPKDDVG